MSIFKKRDPSQLQQQLEQFTKKGGFESDATEWKLAQDKQGNGAAVIRFLPAASDDATTFVKVVNHGFQRNGKWYIENCSSTHGDYDSCPACQWLKEQNWDYNSEADKQAMYASGVTRKVQFWANILVVKDPANPENEGKIFKFRFGKKVMDKIQAEVNVNADLGEVPCDVTCPIEGKNFAYKVTKVGGNNNYDTSAFMKQSSIPNIEDESVQKKLESEMHDIMSLIAADKFKSFEELTTNFNRVMSTRGSSGSASKSAASDFDKQMADFDNSSAGVSGDKPKAKEPEKSQPSEQELLSTGNALDAELDALLNDI